MTKVELKETLNRYGFRTIEGIRTYYSKAELGEDGVVRLRVGEWYVEMGSTDKGYKVSSISKVIKN
jgi:hypothetical protein